MEASEPLSRPAIEETEPATEQVLDTECHDCDCEKDPALFDNFVHGSSRSYFEKQMISDRCRNSAPRK